jgi:hypothetical protein
MMTLLPKLFRDPVLADRTVDLMAAAAWLCFAGWGISSAFAGLATVEQATSPQYLAFWGIIIGTLASVAFTATVMTFFPSRSVRQRIQRKSVELAAVSLLAGFISLYPIFLLIAAIGGDHMRIAPFFLGVQFLILPTWRVRHLFIRIRKLREITSTGSTEIVN